MTWEDQLLGYVLGISVDKSFVSSGQLDRIVYKRSVIPLTFNEEVNRLLQVTGSTQQGLTVKKHAELAIAAQVRNLKDSQSPGVYLLGCLSRVEEQLQYMRIEGDRRLCESLRIVLCRWLSLLLSDVTVFPFYLRTTGHGPAQEIVDFMGKENAAQFIQSMLAALTPSNFAYFFKVVGNLAGLLVSKLSLASQLDTVFNPLRVLDAMASAAETQQVLVHLPNWIAMILMGAAQERNSFLAMFFQPTCLPDDMKVVKTYFTGNMDTPVEQVQDSLRSTLSSLYTILHGIILKLLRTKENREAVLTWVAVMLETNQSRGRMRADMSTVSSDHFFINLCAVLLKLSQPFTDPVKHKLDMIDPLYVLPKSRLDFHNESRIQAPTSVLREWEQQQQKSAVNNSDELVDYSPPWEQHYHIICDGCRTKNFSGVRYKCAQCVDFDLCETCFKQDADSLYVQDSETEQTYQCPYCGDRLGEGRLVAHVLSQHENDTTPVVCPMCAAKSDSNMSQYTRSFHAHLRNLHVNPSIRTHERNHLMFHIAHPCPNPVAQWRAVPPLTYATTATASNQHDPSYSCTSCQKTPLTGTLFLDIHSKAPYCEDCVGGNKVDDRKILLTIPHPVTDMGPVLQYHLDDVWPAVLLPKRQFNFITECFYFTSRALHLGLIKTLGRYSSLLRDLQSAHQPDAIEQLTALKHACDTQLLDPIFLAAVLQFYNANALWFLRLLHFDATSAADTHNIALPPPMEYAAQPEHMLLDMIETILVLAKFAPSSLPLTNCDHIFILFTVLLSNRTLVNNPHLLNRIVEALCTIAPINDADIPTAGVDGMDRIFTSIPYIFTNLSTGLVGLYNDVENTGDDTSFYDKFTARHAIALLLKYLYGLPQHRQVLESWISGHPKAVLSFVNFIMNDANFLLDEMFSKLLSISKFEADRRSSAWNSMHPRQQQEKARENSEREAQVRTFCLLGNETINMVQYLTANSIIRPVFLLPEMVSRVAATIDYFFTELVAHDAQLHLSRSEAYHFNPGRMISQLISVYCNVADADAFVEAVVADGRSFKPELFHTGLGMYRAQRNASSAMAEKFEEFLARAVSLQLSSEQQEEEWQDAPFEFYDPIMSTLMTDPVILPSGNTVDRVVISRHLLSDGRDPFNRAPMTIEDVKPNTELKQQIEEWKAKKRAQSSE